MGRSYKKATMIGLAFVLALSFISVLPATELQASSPHHGMYGGGHHMYGKMGYARYSGPRPETIIRESQENVTCVKWYYQRHGHGYVRIDAPCRYGTAEFDYSRTYRKALLQIQD